MNTETTTAARVAEAMKNADRSQKWTAENAGFSVSTFRRKLNGGADFTVGEVGRIAKVLNVPPADLLPHQWAVALKDVA